MDITLIPAIAFGAMGLYLVYIYHKYERLNAEELKKYRTQKIKYDSKGKPKPPEGLCRWE